MNVAPVAQRELLVASRRPSTRWVRVGAGVAAMVVLSIGLMLGSVGLGNRGAMLFDGLVFLVGFTTACAGFLLTADSISSERREGTLGFLFLTDLNGFEVLTGKLLASGLNALGALLAALPLMGVTLLLGGVTAGDFWRSGLALVNLLWVSLAIGLAMSVRTTQAGRAVAASFVWVVFLFVGFPLAAELARKFSQPTLSAVFETSPAWAVMTARSAYAAHAEAYWRSLLTSHLLGWVFILLASYRVSRFWRQDLSASDTPASRSRHRNWRPATVENPAAALTRPTRREQVLAWIIVILTVAVTALLWSLDFIGQTFSFPIYGASPFTPAYFLLKCAFAWKCCEYFAGLRAGGGELLLTSPLHEWQVLGGGWAGARGWIQAPMLTLLAVQFLTSGIRQLSGNHQDFGQVSWVIINGYTVASQIADLVALAWVSARFGLKSKGPLQAFGLCLAVVFLLRLPFFCVPDLLFSLLLMAWARQGVAQSIRGWITGDRLPPICSREEAARQGRIPPETL